MVEEQEGIVFVANVRRNRTAQFDARALNGGLWFNNCRDSSKVVHACMDVVRGEGITNSQG